MVQQNSDLCLAEFLNYPNIQIYILQYIYYTYDWALSDLSCKKI